MSSASMFSETAKNHMGPDGLIPGAIHPVPGTPRYHGVKFDSDMRIIGKKVQGNRTYTTRYNQDDTYSLDWTEFDGQYWVGGSAGQIIFECDVLSGVGSDVESYVVVQSAPGLYHEWAWSGVRADIKGSIQDIKDPIEFTRAINRAITYLGYVKPTKKIETIALDADVIVDGLCKLINQEEVEHQTNHVKLIFEFMNALWMAIL